MMSLSGKVLSEKVDALQLAFYTAPVSFGAIIPVFLFREVRTFCIDWPASTFLQAHPPMWAHNLEAKGPQFPAYPAYICEWVESIGGVAGNFELQ